MDFEIWNRDQDLLSGEEYLGNQILAREISSKGYKAIIEEYVYIDTFDVAKTFKQIPKACESIIGNGIDLGGGVGCISSTLALKKEVKKIFCVEIVEDVVKLCQPIIKEKILKGMKDKVISIVGDFDHLNLEDNTLDFAVSWDSMHHSRNLVKTLKECKRILKKNGIFIIVDRAHNNSTPDSEIDRMLNIIYDKEFLKKNHRSENEVITRKANGEHEHRFFEWENFFKDAKFEIISKVVIKTESKENRNLKNDNNMNEIFVDYDLGAFGNRKVAFVLKSL